MEKRMITTDVTEEDLPLEGSLRPQTLDEYIGQDNQIASIIAELTSFRIVMVHIIGKKIFFRCRFLYSLCQNLF